LEKLSAWNTVYVVMTLPVVLMQANLILEDSVTGTAVIMLDLVMILQLRCEVEVDVAVLAVMVVRALNVMFFAPQPRSKVILTIVAYPVTA
jgi:hypothetical protein